MEAIRSVLAQVLPVTYSDVDPQGYKNVTVCPAMAPGMAPMPAKQGSGRPAAPRQPGSPGQNTGRRRLQVGTVFLSTSGVLRMCCLGSHASQ